MKYRSLGNTGLNVSVLGFGGSSLGSVFRPIDENEGIRAVRLAIEHGINLIDTAPYYGLTRAETVLGKALRGVPRESYHLATKVGRYGDGSENFDFSAERTLRSVDESLQRLGVDFVDFIQIHDIEFGSIDRIVEETIPALHRIREAGKARFIGITGLPLGLFPIVLDRAEVDQIQSYCHYCLNDTSLTDLLPCLNERGIAVFNSAPLAMRLLSDGKPPDWHPAPKVLREKCAEAAVHCRERGSSLAKLALQFSVANPEIPVTIVGTANPESVVRNVHDIEDPIDEELLTEVLQILRPVHNLTWPSGLPENQTVSFRPAAY
jgi:L-galactose dehydrogenase